MLQIARETPTAAQCVARFRAKRRASDEKCGVTAPVGVFLASVTFLTVAQSNCATGAECVARDLLVLDAPSHCHTAPIGVSSQFAAASGEMPPILFAARNRAR